MAERSCKAEEEQRLVTNRGLVRAEAVGDQIERLQEDRRLAVLEGALFPADGGHGVSHQP